MKLKDNIETMDSIIMSLENIADTQRIFVAWINELQARIEKIEKQRSD
jgi:hypothetical protein